MSDIGQFFHENGYYFAKGVYSSEEAKLMENDFDRVVDKLVKSDENINARWGGRLMDALDGGESVIIHTHNIQSFSGVWLKAFMHDKFLDITEEILGPDIMLHHSKLFCKPPEKGSPFPMHQDWQYFPSEKDSMIAAIIYVSDATDEMGCVRVYPGSHRELGRTDGMMGGGQNEEITDRYPIENATVLEAEPGDVLFFSYFTLHGSMPNHSNKTRKSVLVQMHAGNDQIIPDNRHTNVKLVLRGLNHFATRSSVGRII